MNFCLGIVGVIQVTRILSYNSTHKGETAKEQLEGAKDGVVDAAKGIKGDVENAIKS